MGYIPDESDVHRRVDAGRARARAAPYFFDEDEHLSADGVEMYEKLVDRIVATDGVFCCYLCGGEVTEPRLWHLDHVIPLVLNGPHAVDNLEAACDVCNLGKGALTLEKFLTPSEYAEFIAGGGLPPFKRMRDRPVAELWDRSPRVARRFARRPREVPFVSWEHWYDPFDDRSRFDARIAAELQSRPRAEWRKAMTIQQLRPALGLKRDTSLADNYWLRCMGMNNRPGMPDSYFDTRLWPSPLVIPVRLGRRARYKGFRLRSTLPLGADPRADELQVIDERTRQLPDQDQML